MISYRLGCSVRRYTLNILHTKTPSYVLTGKGQKSRLGNKDTFTWFWAATMCTLKEHLQGLYSSTNITVCFIVFFMSVKYILLQKIPFTK